MILAPDGLHQCPNTHVPPSLLSSLPPLVDDNFSAKFCAFSCLEGNYECRPYIFSIVFHFLSCLKMLMEGRNQCGLVLDVCVVEYKRTHFIMLKDQPAEASIDDPLLGIFEEGLEEFILYEKQHSETYKSHNQKKKEKIAKLERDLNDTELKRKRNAERRNAEKAKINQILSTMSKEERRRKRKEEKQKVRDAMGTGQVIMVDLAYEPLMNGKENKSLAKQIQLIMKGIKQVEHPPSIHLCGYQGGIVAQLEKMGSLHWPITTHAEDILQTGKKIGKKVIYLSPDAELPLEKIETDTAYILGGLIDRTIIKYASLNRAKSFGIESRRLPIRQFMRSRIVLNLDHVVLILCKFSECGDWKEAFDYGAPKRYKRDAAEKKEGVLEQEQSEDSIAEEESQQSFKDQKQSSLLNQKN